MARPTVWVDSYPKGHVRLRMEKNPTDFVPESAAKLAGFLMNHALEASGTPAKLDEVKQIFLTASKGEWSTYERP